MATDSEMQIWIPSGSLARAGGWIKDLLAQHDLAISGAIAQPHARPWSAVLRIPTSGGDVYFKAVAPALRFEPQLTWALSQWRPDCIPPVLGIDTGQGWMLMGDGGQTLREQFRAGPGMSSWHDVLTLFAALQIDLVGRIDELLQMDVRDRRLDLLPQRYTELLEEREWLMIGQPGGLTPLEYQRLIVATPFVVDMCQALATFAIPHSLHHNDLHDGNIFAENGRYLFFDWGDSSISHPFFSLRTVFVSVENTFGLEEDDPIFDVLARSYLRPWRRYATEVHLWQAFQLARRLWALSSAVKYWTILRGLQLDAGEYGRAIPALLDEFLAAHAPEL